MVEKYEELNEELRKYRESNKVNNEGKGREDVVYNDNNINHLFTDKPSIKYFGYDDPNWLKETSNNSDLKKLFDNFFLHQLEEIDIMQFIN